MDIPVLKILAGTPTWVLILCVFLVVRGLKSMRPSVRKIDKVWITPGLFILWGLIGLFERSGNFSGVLLHWLIGAAIGGVVGLAGKMTLQVDDTRRLVLLSGSVMPFIRVAVIFGAHYVLNVAAVLHPDSRSLYMGWDTCVSGASAGYFAGWAWRFFQSCRQAPRADLSAQLRNPA